MAKASEEKKNSFKLYNDSLSILELLSDEEAGQLFKAIYQYVIGKRKTLPDFGDNRTLVIAFTPIKNYIDRDTEKYIQKCMENQENGKKGGRPPKNNSADSTPQRSDPEDEEEKLPFS